MQLISNHPAKYTVAQKLFIEKTIESLHRSTIDTYRARVMNPRTIIDELGELIKERLRGRIPNLKAIQYAAEEAKILLENSQETLLEFSPFSDQTIIANIGQLFNDQKPEVLKKILIVLKNFSQKYNYDYSTKLFKDLANKIETNDTAKSIAENETHLESIIKTTSFLITELMNKGFTKRFLYRKLSDIFNSKESKDFGLLFEKFQKLSEYEPTEYSVVFKLEIPDSVVSSLSSFKDVVISDTFPEFGKFIEQGKVHPAVLAFKNNLGRSTHFYTYDLRAYDLFQALNKARINFSENIDLIHLGYSEEYINAWPQVLVVSKISETDYYFVTKALAYDLDGFYKGGKELYKSFVDGITKIELNKEIKSDSKEKIKSAIRYLRLGNEAIEVEHKFINYWVALEYIFSDTITDNQDNTINKIKKVFPRIHSNIFVIRLIKDYHDNIKRLKLTKRVPDFSEKYMEYLCKESTYNWIIENLSSDFPLLTYRALKIKAILFTPIPADKTESPIEKRLKKHKKDLELHLARMYRIRNSIVHDAAIGKNIITITANLKYYLVFIISHIIKALEQNHALRSIEDLFALDEAVYDSLEKERFPIKKILAIDTHFEMID